MCNNVRNCKGGWDEENCGPVGSAIPLDFTAAHVIIILILLLLIMLGMCVGMVYNLVRKLSEDKEDILSSRDKSLASLASVESVPGVPSPPKSRASRLTDHTGGDDGLFNLYCNLLFRLPRLLCAGTTRRRLPFLLEILGETETLCSGYRGYLQLTLCKCNNLTSCKCKCKPLVNAMHYAAAGAGPDCGHQSAAMTSVPRPPLLYSPSPP